MRGVMRTNDNGWRQPFKQSMALFRYLSRGHCTPPKVEEHWHRTFSCVAKHLGFNRSARRILWNDLVQGNWKRLHATDEEEQKTPDEWLDELRWEVYYCSDRWSLDRLTRCHWLYRQYRWSVWRIRNDG